MARLADGDPRNLLGEDNSGDRFSTARAPKKTGASRPTAADRVAAVAKLPAATKRAAHTSARTPDMYDRLADLFHGQPWVAGHRGNTALGATIPIDTGLGLTAKILRDRITAEERFEGRPQDRIEEVVEFAMKHFFDRLPNDQRGGRLVNRFVGDYWWDTLVDEAIAHWELSRVSEEAFERGREATEAFYAAWPKKPPRDTSSAPSEAAKRFMQILTETDQPNYDDCEPLT